MTVKKTFRITEYRNTQLEIMQGYLKSRGYKGSQTEIIEKAIMEMYFSMRRVDWDYFEEKEKEMFGTDDEIEALSKRVRSGEVDRIRL